MYERSRTEGHALTVSYDFGAAVLKSISAYRKLRWADSLDLDGTPLPVVQSQRATRYSSFSQELQLTGSAYDERLNYVTGLYYFHDDAKSDNGLNILGGGTRTASSFGSRTTAWAVYGQADFSVTDQLTLTGGLRYTEEKKDIRRRQTLLAAPGVPAAVLPLDTMDLPFGGVPDARYHNLSPALSIRYEPSDELNLYARWARGFKSGGFNGETEVVRAPTADCPTGLVELCNPYAAEKVDSYEIGMKSRLLDRRLVLNLAAFWDEHKDLQLSIFQGGTTAASVVTNAGSARIRGIEAEAVFRPISTLTLNGSVAFLDLEYLTFIDAGVDVADNRAFPQSPRRTASLSADWQVLDAGFGKLNLVGDVSYSSAYFTYPYPLRTPTPSAQNAYNTRSPGQTIVNVRAVLSDLQVAGTQAEVALWVKNLLDEDRPRNLLDFGPGFGGLTVAYFPDPRTFGVTVRSRF
jgi:iron complex outermembrane receptor protein